MSTPRSPRARRLASVLSGLAIALSLTASSSARASAGIPAGAAAWVEPPPAEASTAPAEPHRFALVVGSNHTLDPEQAPLRFADDDAARVAELLVETGVDTELVTHLDRDSQAVFPTLVAQAHRPDAAGVERAYGLLLERMQAAKERGETVELLVYYSGHGDVGPDGQGYLTLDGDKLTRRALFGGLLSRSPADHNHVIIDACRSEQFVLSRGKDWKPDRAAVDLSRSVETYLDKNHLGAFPNTGVVLAHSADQQTHEWDRYRGGIFTHELLSGLRGGADLNGDGDVEYSELGAFVSAANHGVDDPRARLEVVVRPPVDDQRRPLLGHGRLADKRLLLFGPGDRYHYTVEDARGVRLADVRRSGEASGYLRLPDGELFIGRRLFGATRQEIHVPAGERGVLLAHGLGYTEAPAASRGSLDQAFRRGLFATPFGPGYYHGYTAQRGLLPVAADQWQGPTVDEPAPAGEAVGPEPAPEPAVVIHDGEAKGEDDESKESEERESALDKVARMREQSTPWGGILLGLPVTPFSAGIASATQRRITANEMEACLSPRQGLACAHLRGFDLRWQVFRVHKGARFPRWLGYFRTGYEAGRVRLGRDGGLASGDAQQLSYLAVPLYFGGNLYLFDEFPLRPFAGLGLGLDVIRLDYDRIDADRLVDTVARPGFEVHAGLEVRITNYVSLTGEVRQQWSARKKISGVPDFANEGVTIITGLAIGFPLRPPRRR